MSKNRKPVFPIILIFVILNGAIIATKHLQGRYNIDNEVLIIGNCILFVITLISFFIAKQTLLSNNPQAFVRGMYLSIMVKFFVCIVAALIYIYAFRKELNKPALFTCMGLYLVYTFMEVAALTKLLKEKKNA